jgi:hypothetical protein
MKRTIPDKESLTVEFKSDAKRLSDSELVLAVVCLADTQQRRGVILGRVHKIYGRVHKYERFGVSVAWE